MESMVVEKNGKYMSENGSTNSNPTNKKKRKLKEVVKSSNGNGNHIEEESKNLSSDE